MTDIPATDLVPGDTVRLESGDMVPADLRITASIGLRVDESMLTGEVLPTAKRSGVSDHGVELAEDAPLGDRVTVAYSGTLVVSGRATGLVVTTGRDTELGSIADLVQTDSGKTPLQILTGRLEKTIAVLLVVVGVAVFITNLILGTGLGDAFRSTVALIVSSMPEALPVVLSVAMGVGVSRMATRNAVVRHLPSVETPGSTTVIGSDKTGTLAVNRMTVETVWTPTGLDGTPSLRTGALTNDATVHPDGDTLIGDAVDVAMASAALARGVVTGEERSTAPVADMPYEPEYAYSQTLRRETGEDGTDRLVLHVKGAPEVVASFCRGTGGGSVLHEAMEEANHAMAADGLRVIATASRILGDDEVPDATKALDTPHDLQFTGLQGMMDPPREGVREAIGQCRSAGIHVMMITGDHPVPAVAIGKRLGLGRPGDEPLTGRDMVGLDDAQPRERLRHTSVAARMSPQDKLRIVKQLKADGATVAVTIVDAVHLGRVTFSSIRKATFFLISNGLALMTAVVVNTFTELPLIFLPVMLLFMNIVTNGIQDIALSFEKGEGDELDQKPRSKDEGVLDTYMWMRSIITGLWMDIGTLLVYRVANDQGCRWRNAAHWL
ncbi:cation-translocating P-type ATPase [Corynebacterium variabile]|uniref:cation-translocating P-type ATPase n=1 Tax=Corynebacterium variabile TaxID=1727 RepID=UPI003C8AFB1A